MRTLFLVAVFAFVPLTAHAQQVELPCPSGSSPLSGFTTTNASTGKLRQNICIDVNGNLYYNNPILIGVATGGLSFVSSLPVTCTPGVTANVVGSVSITTNNQTYPAGQEFFCAAPPAPANTWSPVSGSVDPGIFNTTATISTQASPHVFAVNCDQNCPTRIYNNAFGSLGGAGFTDTDAVDGAIVVPSSGVTNAVSTGVQGWAYNNNSSNSGQFGFVGAVGIGGYSFCKAGGASLFARCFGASLGAQSFTGNGGSFLAGAEADITANNNADNGFGFLASMRGTGSGSATQNAFPAFWVQQNTGATNQWTAGLVCDNASLSTAAGAICAMAGKQVASGASGSSGIDFTANDGSADYITGFSALGQSPHMVSLCCSTALRAQAYYTTTNCASSGGTCGSASSGSVSIAAAATTVTVATTAVTANSVILLSRDDTLGTKLSVTCNTATAAGDIKASTRTAGTSFVITVQNAPATNPLCLSYLIVN